MNLILNYWPLQNQRFLRFIISYPFGSHVSFTAKRNFAEIFGGGGFVVFISNASSFARIQNEKITKKILILQNIFFQKYNEYTNC